MANLFPLTVILLFVSACSGILLEDGAQYSGTLALGASDSFNFSIATSITYSMDLSLYGSLSWGIESITLAGDSWGGYVGGGIQTGDLVSYVPLATSPCFTGSGVEATFIISCSAYWTSACTYNFTFRAASNLISLPYQASVAYGAYQLFTFVPETTDPVTLSFGPIYDTYFSQDFYYECGSDPYDLVDLCLDPSFNASSVPIYTYVTEPSTMGYAPPYYGQYFIEFPQVGKAYTYWINAGIPYGRTAFNFSITQGYNCSTTCQGNGVCVSNGTCLCDLSGNPTDPTCSVPGYNQLAANGTVYNGVIPDTTTKFLVFEVLDTPNVIYQLSAAVGSSFQYYIGFGLDCIPKTSSCLSFSYTSTISDFICPQDAGWYTLSLYTGGESSFTAQLNVTANVYPSLSAHESYAFNESVGTFSFVPSGYLAHPTITLIGDEAGTKAVHAALSCYANAAIAQTATTANQRAVQLVFSDCIEKGSLYTIWTNDTSSSSSFEIVIGEAGNCTNNCNHNGICLPNNTCLCDSEYSGASCSVMTSPPTPDVVTAGIYNITFDGVNPIVYAINTPAASYVKVQVLSGLNGSSTVQMMTVNTRLNALPALGKNTAAVTSTLPLFYGPASLEDSVTYLQFVTADAAEVSINITLADATIYLGESLKDAYPANGVIYKVLEFEDNCTSGFYISAAGGSYSGATSIETSIFDRPGKYFYNDWRFNIKNCSAPLLLKVSNPVSTSPQPFSTSLSTLTCPAGCSGNGDCYYNGNCRCRDSFSGDACQTVGNCEVAPKLSFCTEMSGVSVSAVTNAFTGCPGTIEYYDQILLPQKYNELKRYYGTTTCQASLKTALCNMYLRPCTTDSLTVPCESYCSSFFTQCPLNTSVLAVDSLGQCGQADFAFMSERCVNGTAQVGASSSYTCAISPFSTASSTSATSSPASTTSSPASTTSSSASSTTSKSSVSSTTSKSSNSTSASSLTSSTSSSSSNTTASASATTGSGFATSGSGFATTGSGFASTSGSATTGKPTSAPVVIIVTVNVTISISGDPSTFDKDAFAAAFAASTGFPISGITITIVMDSKRAVHSSFHVVVSATQSLPSTTPTASLAQFSAANIESTLNASLSNSSSAFNTVLSGYTVSSVSASTAITQTTVATTSSGASSTASVPSSTTGKKMSAASSVPRSFSVLFAVVSIGLALLYV